jgi:hypothetical protein
MQALGCFVPAARFQIELVGVQWANDFVVSNQAFGKRALAVRAAVLDGEQTAIALAKDCDLFGCDRVTAPLA